ncbi:hypothetical protein KBB49_00905 [Candidatus Saccharibacteria bacterium]|nr:hypothetical protein [Candidatus Saccharibacteria bacterium]
MLQLSSIFYNQKILSLRSGGPIGHASCPLIDPDNLKIEGWYATALGDKKPMILPVMEVRDIISKGIVVNDHSSLTHIEDLVRQKRIIELSYELIGKLVRTDDKKRLGKVQDYAVDDESLFIKKLYINQNIFKNLTAQQLVIDRNQIIEITDKEIIIKNYREKAPVGETATATS